MTTREPDMNHIGDHIRITRGRAGLSQQELAERSGISKAQISRLEAGSQDNPGIKTLIPIASALGVSLEELIYGEQSENISYMNEVIENMEEEDKKAIKKLIRGFVLITQAEKMKE
jgi:XRE family transcriptional regulator, regulator of sulfur utilization